MALTDEYAQQTVVITGSSDGIGLASAKLFLDRGAHVVINARQAGKLERAQKELSENKAKQQSLVAVVADVNEPGSSTQLLDAALAINGRIDVLVNNVGGGSENRFLEDIDPNDWNSVIQSNLTSCYSLCKKVLPHMQSQAYGRIVNVSSIAGRHKGRLSGPQYSAAKAGMQGFTRHIAWDFAEQGITVNAVAPGFVMTERALKKWHARTEQDKKQLLESVPMRRFARPEEIASAILYLASPLASYITGVTLDVNGGAFMS